MHCNICEDSEKNYDRGAVLIIVMDITLILMKQGSHVCYEQYLEEASVKLVL